jgi:ISXO2-like transposase domain
MPSLEHHRACVLSFALHFNKADRRPLRRLADCAPYHPFDHPAPRGAPGKTPFVAAVETTIEGKPVRLRLRRVRSFCGHSSATFAKTSQAPDCAVASNGLLCFTSVTDARCSHQVIPTGGGTNAARSPAFKWVNTALGNIKAAIVGTYCAINTKHVPRYLAEFEYRFNRRYDLAAMIPRLTWAGVRTPPHALPPPEVV